MLPMLPITQPIQAEEEMVDIEISEGKRARTAYSFDDISIASSRRTREHHDVSLSWQIDAYKFDLPLLSVS